MQANSILVLAPFYRGASEQVQINFSRRNVRLNIYEYLGLLHDGHSKTLQIKNIKLNLLFGLCSLLD